MPYSKVVQECQHRCLSHLIFLPATKCCINTKIWQYKLSFPLLPLGLLFLLLLVTMNYKVIHDSVSACNIPTPVFPPPVFPVFFHPPSCFQDRHILNKFWGTVVHSTVTDRVSFIVFHHLFTPPSPK